MIYYGSSFFSYYFSVDVEMAEMLDADVTHHVILVDAN